MDYTDKIYELAQELPRWEDFNLKTQITRAATSISLNIAEGSTSQSNAEQARFLGLAIRSLVETIACHHLIYRRNYLSTKDKLRETYLFGEKLFAKLQAMRSALIGDKIREMEENYEVESDTPFK